MFHRLRWSSVAVLLVMLTMITSVVVGQSEQKKNSLASHKLEPLPKLLSLREQTAVREQWLKKRLDTLLLPMMRRHGVSMWIVTTEEFHSDTIAEYIAPPIPYVGRRDFFLFTDRGTDKLERIALVRYPEEHLKFHFEVLNPPGNQIASTLRKLVEE